MFCREHVVQLHRQIDDIHGAGAELVVIGNGTPNFIAGFRDKTAYIGPLYTDPSLKVFKAAQLKRSMAANLNPLGIARAARALSRGHLQGRTQGDAAQQGGLLVIASDGNVKYHHISSGPGDLAPMADVIRALG